MSRILMTQLRLFISSYRTMPELVTKKATFIYNHNGTPASCQFTYRTDSSYLGQLRLDLVLKMTVQHLQHTNKTLGMLTHNDSLTICHAVERELFRIVAEDAGVDLETGEDLACCAGAICASAAPPRDNTICNPVSHPQNGNVLHNQPVSARVGNNILSNQPVSASTDNMLPGQPLSALADSPGDAQSALSFSDDTGATLGTPAASHDSLSDSETIVCNHKGRRLRTDALARHQQHGNNKSLLGIVYHRLWKAPKQNTIEYIRRLRAQPRFGLARYLVIL